MHGQHANPAERSQGGSRHRAGLHDERDAQANQDCHIVVHVRRTHDHLLCCAHDETVQELHQTEQGAGDDDQREDQPHDAAGNITHAGKGTFVQDSATLDGLRIKLVSFQVASVRAAAMVQEREVGAALCQGGIGVLVDLLPVLAHGRGKRRSSCCSPWCSGSFPLGQSAWLGPWVHP